MIDNKVNKLILDQQNIENVLLFLNVLLKLPFWVWRSKYPEGFFYYFHFNTYSHYLPLSLWRRGSAQTFYKAEFWRLYIFLLFEHNFVLWQWGRILHCKVIQLFFCYSELQNLLEISKYLRKIRWEDALQLIISSDYEIKFISTFFLVYLPCQTQCFCSQHDNFWPLTFLDFACVICTLHWLCEHICIGWSSNMIFRKF